MSLKVVFQNKFDIYLYMSNDLNKGYRHKSKTKKLISQLQLGEKHWSYKGKFVFYHQEENYFVGDMKSFSLEKNIIYSACSKLVNNTISSYKKWICLGQYNDNFKLPINDINNIYRKILNRGCDYYAFYNKNDEHFIGTFGEFLKKYNLKRNNIKGIINGKRLSASGWICMGKCDEKYIFPKNIKEIYDIRISKNKKLKNH